jgi:hypothetical protein
VARFLWGDVSPRKRATNAEETSAWARGTGLNDELRVSVKDQMVRILVYGATLVTSVEGFFHGRERRAVRDVIESHPELFEMFTRGFPETGPKSLWVRLKRAGDS